MIEVKYTSEVPYLVSCDQCDKGPIRGIGWYTITSHATWYFCSESCSTMFILRWADEYNGKLESHSLPSDAYPKV